MNRKSYLQKCADRRREIKKLRDAKWTLAKIAAKYGITYQAVQSALRNV